MGSKAFLPIVLAIFLVITSEVAARKLAQSSITSGEKQQTNEANKAKFLGVAFPPIGGPIGIGEPIETRRMFESKGILRIGAPIGVKSLSETIGLSSEIGAPIGVKSLSETVGLSSEIGAPIGVKSISETVGLSSEIGAPIGVRGLSETIGLLGIEAPIGFEGLSERGELIEIGTPIESGGLP